MLALVLPSDVASAVVFTNDTLIGLLQTNYDGQDIVISNCTLTVDGPHSFASLRAAAGSVLTHSASSNGIITAYISITDELHALPGTTPVLLNNSNVAAPSIEVHHIAGILTYTNMVDYLVGSSNNFTTIERTPTSSIPDGITVSVNYQYAAAATNAGLTLTLSGNLEVEPGATINTAARGMGGNSGQGNGSELGNPLSGGGAGYGGYGGLSSSNAAGGVPYGNPFQPANLGSGGGASYVGPGGEGGGLLRITAGTVLVNGTITANGADATNSRAGGGSGGSIWLTAQDFGGSGSIVANGGGGEPIHGGGGGGGRIAIELASNSFLGNITAYGGPGAQRGGAGTIFVLTNSSATGQLTFDNGGIAGAPTLVSLPAAHDLTVQGRAVGVLSTAQSVRNLIVRSNSSLIPITTNLATFTLNVTGNAVLEQGASISLDAKGYIANSGSGPGLQNGSVGGGGGHGGAGGSGQSGTTIALGGTYYGSSMSPTSWGSGGRTIIIGNASTTGGVGGGAIRLTIFGNLHLDGRISANGGAGLGTSSGGGAGGSIWVSLSGLSGSGVLSANGGSGGLPIGGGGGGGRISITYLSNSFGGTLSAYGGTGAVAGGAGTIYTRNNNSPSGKFLADNGGLSGTNTLLDISGGYNLAISNGASIRTTLSTVQVNDLDIGPNAAFFFRSMSMSIVSNATIAPGGALTGDGQGQTPNSQGQGGSSFLGSGGGGHGGAGGAGAGLDQTGRGGATFGFAHAPILAGGAGGASPSPGPAGGGGLQLTINGLLRLNGNLSANGASVSTNNGGGGAGGGLLLTVRHLIGNGTISANGGNGYLPNSGGGGGGRIALIFSNAQPTNLFTGTLSATGGNGLARGGAGTVYLYTNGANSALVTVDNGGFRGASTSISASGIPFDVRVQNGASATALGTARDLLVRTNGFVTQTGNVAVTRNVTIDVGGAVALDGITSFGTGAGSGGLPRGGAGHGGYGAFNPIGGGAVYGSALNPITAGSQGGTTSGTTGTTLGSYGGGAIHLTVPGTLLVNGRISANGVSGEPNSGGGSGGSIWLTLGTLLGNGQISASGGNGAGAGGGGGGGRIAITYNNNMFDGTVSACGGTGSAIGGAGTIYLKNNINPIETLWLNNCGFQGTNTPVSQNFGTAPNLQVTAGAVAELQGSIPLLSNVAVTAGGTVTCRSVDPSLQLGVAGNVSIDSVSVLQVDAKGYARGLGPGAGSALSNKGSGGGYGGGGGASGSGAAGGTTYGSSAQPVDRGSGGGPGYPANIGGSEGGGAVHLTVGGSLSLAGNIRANGSAGLQDDSGGGSGGSVWINAAAISGGGSITANGGAAESLNGGGGGGGRIAIYSPANTFTGLVSVAGGIGGVTGQTGTVFSSISYPAFQLLSHSPSGLVTNTVSFIDLIFSEAIDPASVSAADVAFFTPAGPANVTLTVRGLTTLRASFPEQNLLGDYRVEAGPGITDILGQPMSQVYTGAFTISLPTISGRITDMFGAPVAGVSLQPSGGLQPVLTDANGNYLLGIPYGWSGTVRPVLTGSMFLPGSRSYNNATGGLLNDYLALPAPTVTGTQSGTNFVLSWYTITNVNYQVYYSTNLINWDPWGPQRAGINDLLTVVTPLTGLPANFFRVAVQN